MRTIALPLAALLLLTACGGGDEDGFVRRTLGRSSGEGSDAKRTDGAGLLDPAIASCANGVKDGDETDVDCGGATCPACANGNACAAGNDCVSRVCTAGVCANDVGCADGTREGFAVAGTFPNIAACAGAWAIPGLVTTTAPACSHTAGNDSTNPTGAGCNVADLCQAGWHVCATASEVAAKSYDDGCAAAAITGGAFFVARQSGAGGAQCSTGTDDLFGCGDVGGASDPATCGPLNRFSGNLCAALPSSWSCGADGTAEATNVVKTASAGGGVLCCRD